MSSTTIYMDICVTAIDQKCHTISNLLRCLYYFTCDREQASEWHNLSLILVASLQSWLQATTAPHNHLLRGRRCQSRRYKNSSNKEKVPPVLPQTNSTSFTLRIILCVTHLSASKCITMRRRQSWCLPAGNKLLSGLMNLGCLSAWKCCIH